MRKVAWGIALFVAAVALQYYCYYAVHVSAIHGLLSWAPALLGAAIFLLTWKTNNERFYTAVLLGTTASLIASNRDWALAFGWAPMLLAMYLLRNTRFGGSWESRLS